MNETVELLRKLTLSNSTSSVDAVLSNAEGDDATNSTSWPTALSERISSILSHNRRRGDEREKDLKWYLGILRHHYAAGEISAQASSISKSLLRLVGSDSAPDTEVLLALKCLSITAITASEAEDFYDIAASPLKSTIQTHDSDVIKAEALQTLSLITFVCGTETDAADLLLYLLDAISSDGTVVSAPDSAAVVTAAIESYALLTTSLSPTTSSTDLETLHENSHDAIDALAEQLESSSPAVLIATGETIALLYAKSWREADPDSDNLSIDPQTGELPTLVQMYAPYRRTDTLLNTLRRLARHSGKGTSKADRRALHETFDDVVQSLENPGFGPRFSTSTGWKPPGKYSGSAKADAALGNRSKVRISGGGGNEKRDESQHLTVDTWDLWWRVHALQRCLTGAGLIVHYGDNETVTEILNSSDR